MDAEFPVDVDDFLRRQARSMSRNPLDDDEALKIGKLWKFGFAWQLEQLADHAKECLYMMDLPLLNSEVGLNAVSDATLAAIDFFWRCIAESPEISKLVTLRAEWDLVPYLCQLSNFTYDQVEDTESCRRYFELLVELGQ